jgi:phosphoribosyl 1,2-cyclic phosphodiesterase
MTVTEAPKAAPFHLLFRGVRGSIPTPSPEHAGIGGNTPCVQILSDPDAARESEELLILDAGTGIRALGREIAARQHPPREIHIFLTHFHWDHLQGLPYFPPIFSAHTHLVFHSAHPPDQLRAVLTAQMQDPYFPVLFDQLASRMEFRTIGSEPQRFGSLTIEAFPLFHPQGSVGFRVIHPKKTAIYATDYEHSDPESHRDLIAIAQEADLLVYDAQYTPAEYESRQGWGHSTWLEATRVAQQAGVKTLVLFHHDPDRDDQAIHKIEEEARKLFPSTFAAYEGLVL